MQTQSEELLIEKLRACHPSSGQRSKISSTFSRVERKKRGARSFADHSASTRSGWRRAHDRGRDRRGGQGGSRRATRPGRRLPCGSFLIPTSSCQRSSGEARRTSFLNAIRANPVTDLHTSSILLAELADVLGRPAVSRRLAAIGRSASAVLVDYVEAVELIEPIEVICIAPDPDDDHVVACAVAANSQWIVSGDLDLLDLGTFRGIRILSAPPHWSCLRTPRSEAILA